MKVGFFTIMNLFSFKKGGGVIKEKILTFLFYQFQLFFVYMYVYLQKVTKTVIYDRLLYDLYIYILFYRLFLRAIYRL